MFRRFLDLASAVVVLASAGALAQAPAIPARSLDAPGSVVYHSAFEGYRPYSEPERQSWRASNDEAGTLGGHVGQIRGAASSMNRRSDTRRSTAAPQRGEAHPPSVASPSTPPRHDEPAHKTPGASSHRGHK